MNFYAYCLSNEVTARMIKGVAGVAGASPRLLQCAEAAVVVSEFEGEQVAATRENVFAHERVIRQVLPYTTPLPFRFGTLTSEERLKSYAANNREALLASLARVRGSVEMSVKIIWNPDETKREQEGEAPAQPDETGEENRQGKGTAFLAAKRREILGDEFLKDRAEEIAAWLRERFQGTTIEADVRVSPTETLIVRAAFLVQRNKLDNYRRIVEEAQREREKLRFLTSGPWPPYSFSNIHA